MDHKCDDSKENMENINTVRYQDDSIACLFTPRWVPPHITEYCKWCVIRHVTSQQTQIPKAKDYNIIQQLIQNIQNTSTKDKKKQLKREYVVCQNQRVAVKNIKLNFRFYEKNLKMRAKYILKQLYFIVTLISIMYTFYSDIVTIINRLSNFNGFEIDNYEYLNWDKYQCIEFTLLSSSNLKRGWVFLMVFTIFWTRSALYKSKTISNFIILRIVFILSSMYCILSLLTMVVYITPMIILYNIPFLLLLTFVLICLFGPLLWCCCELLNRISTCKQREVDISNAISIQRRDNDNGNCNNYSYDNGNGVRLIEFEKNEDGTTRIKSQNFADIDHSNVDIFANVECLETIEQLKQRQTHHVFGGRFSAGTYVAIPLFAMWYLLFLVFIPSLMLFYNGQGWWNSLENVLTQRKTIEYANKFADETSNVLKFLAWFF